MSVTRFTVVLLVASLFSLNTVRAMTATYTETRTNTSDIVVPHFDTALGTLDSVNLRVSLLPGSTSVPASHSHSIASTILSSNIVEHSSSNITFTPTTRTTNPNGTHNHTATSPAYSGGGFNFAPFGTATVNSGVHTHQVSISPGTPVLVDNNPFGDDEYRVRAHLSVDTKAGVPQSYNGSTHIYTYTGADLTPFMTLLDILVPTSSFSTNSSGLHGHQLGSFTVPLNIGGIASFNATTLSTSGNHTHTIAPRFTTVATFTYTQVPEPTTCVGLSLGLLGMLVRRQGKR